MSPCTDDSKGCGVGVRVDSNKLIPRRPLRPCKHPGCPVLTREPYCPEHAKVKQREREARRGTANQRGYTYRWNKYSKWYLRQPENQICKLRIDQRCKLIAECVDHIVPPNGPDDPLFWDENNHQASCLVCNSIKGARVMVGKEWDV